MRSFQSTIHLHFFSTFHSKPTPVPGTMELGDAAMFLSPMLLETARAPFDSPDHIFEPKVDGHRLLYSRSDEGTSLYTRSGEDIAGKYPELLEGIADDDILLDGEVALTDPTTGRISIDALNERFRLEGESAIEAAARARPVSLILFDILRYRGKDVRSLPLLRRKELLADVRLRNPQILTMPYLESHGSALFERIRERGMEGIVAKEKMSRYAVGRRARKWQKIINWTVLDVVITGYRKSRFGWQAAVPDGDGGFRPIGMIERGVGPAHKKAFYAVCRSIESGSYRDMIHLEPRLRARVKTRNLTRSGTLRDAEFVDWIA